VPRTRFDIQFEWDPRKARVNQAKHEIGFESAATIFDDRNALTLYDEQHSRNEDRWITLGRDAGGKLLVVVHTWREMAPGTALVRIISARPATRREREQYGKSP